MVIDLEALISEAQSLVEGAEPEIVSVMIGRRQVGVRFLPMMGVEWRGLVLKHPPRIDVMQDINLGYNVDAVVSAYPHVALIEGDEVDDMMRADGAGNTVSRWPAVWSALTATGRKDVAREIWAAHEVTPERVVVDAGKALPASRKKKRS